MSTTHESQSTGQRRGIYIVSALLLIVIALIGLFTFNAARSSVQATDKANQLVAELKKAGATRVPSVEAITRVLGDDGGAVCAADPNAPLTRATALAALTNGAAGPGIRPVIAPTAAVQGELLILKVYCPKQLEAFKSFVDDLNLANTSGG
jgi:hypothetical protein